MLWIYLLYKLIYGAVVVITIIKLAALLEPKQIRKKFKQFGYVGEQS